MSTHKLCFRGETRKIYQYILVEKVYYLGLCLRKMQVNVIAFATDILYALLCLPKFIILFNSVHFLNNYLLLCKNNSIHFHDFLY